MAISEFYQAIQQRIDDLRHQLQEALMDDDFAEAARVQCALVEHERIHHEHRTEFDRLARGRWRPG
jgi:protein-arginine kinase activator protein McsA